MVNTKYCALKNLMKSFMKMNYSYCLSRYQPNPEPNWGPKPRAKRLRAASSCTEGSSARSEGGASSAGEEEKSVDTEQQL